jgi:DNA-binding transcriptional regulator LsrR (DeoR family)
VAGKKRDNSDQEKGLAARAAWLSYIGGHTQSEIAARLQVSPAKAHRLIAQAVDLGLVKVFVEGAPEECLELENELVQAFGLRSCHVAPDLNDTDNNQPKASFSAVGASAARYLHGMIEQNGPMLIGVGKGRSLAAMVQNLPTINRPDIRFVSVSGSLTRNLSANPYDVIHNLVEKTGGEGYFLPVPYIAATVEEKETLLAQSSVQDLLDLARQADIYVIGIGTVEGDAHVRQVGMVSEDEWQELRGLGAVGDVMGRFVDTAGEPVSSEVNEHSVGLHIEDLRDRPVVAVVGGDSKGDAVLGALRTGIVTDLILGERSARQIVESLAAEQTATPERKAG